MGRAKLSVSSTLRKKQTYRTHTGTTRAIATRGRLSGIEVFQTIRLADAFWDGPAVTRARACEPRWRHL